jgi:hypothetical protein
VHSSVVEFLAHPTPLGTFDGREIALPQLLAFRRYIKLTKSLRDRLTRQTGFYEVAAQHASGRLPIDVVADSNAGSLSDRLGY